MTFALTSPYLCRYVSGTLADWVSYYPQAWPDPRTRPEAYICTVQYDFKRYYEPRMNKISGMYKTEKDPGTVHVLPTQAHS